MPQTDEAFFSMITESMHVFETACDRAELSALHCYSLL